MKSWLQLADKPRMAGSIAASQCRRGQVFGYGRPLLADLAVGTMQQSVASRLAVVAAFTWLRVAKPPIWWLLLGFIAFSVLIGQF